MELTSKGEEEADWENNDLTYSSSINLCPFCRWHGDRWLSLSTLVTVLSEEVVLFRYY
jgi:hypothetical protein